MQPSPIVSPTTAAWSACLFFLLMPFITSAQRADLGIFENTTDVGEVVHPGSVAYDAATDTYTITGSGSNMWGATDEMRYLWKSIQGDFILYAEVEFLGRGLDPHRKIGWTVRDHLGPHAPMVNGAVHGDGMLALQFRKEEGAETEHIIAPDSSHNVIRLERKGNTFTFSTAKMGEPFASVEVSDIELRNEVFAGLYVCSHVADVVEGARFRNVRITKPAPDDLVQYRDYLGSRLEVLDLETGIRTVLLNSDHSLQAPNWSTDGKRLIYNSNGFLYNYDLAKGEVSQLNTGFATDNNNDHVLSFDGSLLAISHYVAEDDNKSTVFVMPSNGSDAPKRVTRPGVGHSYLHGISPDNRKVVFTGQRNDKWDIHTVDIETGEETALTDTDALDDGAEYSPDGKHVYFNSTRSGQMQLWRIDADGGNPTRLTHDDDFNDWFPHVSPDGKQILFLSFGTDVEPELHPFYKHVTLRTMPIGGGEPKIVAYLYGGQGSINVPSWSPDGKKVAFVTNTGW